MANKTKQNYLQYHITVLPVHGFENDGVQKKSNHPQFRRKIRQFELRIA